jgi:hypothetical protein
MPVMRMRSSSSTQSGCCTRSLARPKPPNTAQLRPAQRKGTRLLTPRSEEFAALAAHIVENGFVNAATPRLDACRRGRLR